MLTDPQKKTYNDVREAISRLRGSATEWPVPPQPDITLTNVSELHECPNPRHDGYLGANDRKVAKFKVNGAHVFIEEDGRILDNGMPEDCLRYSTLVTRDNLHAVAVDLLMKDNPHKPFLDINSHTPESFENYLKTGIPLAKEYPFPIAIVSQKMGNEANGMRSFNLLLDLFEVIVRFIVLVQIADYMRGSQQSQDKVLEWCRAGSRNPHLNFSQLSLGDWESLFCSLPQFPTEKPFLTELRGLNIDEQMLGRFVKLRNTYRHGIDRGKSHAFRYLWIICLAEVVRAELRRNQ